MLLFIKITVAEYAACEKTMEFDVTSSAHELLYDKLEALHDEEAFDELLQLAAATCLRQPLELLPFQPPSDPAVARLGLWGVRGACEITLSPFPDEHGPHTGYTSSNFEQIIRGEVAISDVPSPQVQQKIESFGKTLLEDAFVSLGTDAPQWVEKYRQAHSAQEQLAVLAQMMRRVYNIAHDGDGDNASVEVEEDEIPSEAPVYELREVSPTQVGSPSSANVSGESIAEISRRELIAAFGNVEANQIENEADPYFYHPVRLSPRLIGEYPDIHVAPTCLGISLLVASFLEKAGATYLHGGVMSTVSNLAVRTQVIMIDDIRRYANTNDIVVPDHVDDILTKIMTESEASGQMHRGYHAAVLVRLLSNKWMHLDMNYGSNVILGKDDSELIDKAYAQVKDISGLEQALSLADALEVAAGGFVVSMLEKQEEAYEGYPVITLPDANQVLTTMMESDEPFEVLAQHMMSLVAATEGFDILIDPVLKVAGKESKTEYTERLIRRMLPYVFAGIDISAPEEPIKAALERCKQDIAYRQRRVEDLTMVPLYAALAAQGDTINGIRQQGAHTSASDFMEVGMPRYRIGAAVLSDFSVYTGNTLSSEFWRRHWPSQTIITEHPAHQEEHPARQSRHANLGAAIASSPLHYEGINDILRSFLEQQPKEGEQQHGSDHQEHGPA